MLLTLLASAALKEHFFKMNHIQYIAPLGATEYAAALVLSLLYAAVCIVCAIGESEIRKYNIIANRKIRR